MAKNIIIPEKIKLSHIKIVNAYIDDDTINDNLNLKFSVAHNKKHNLKREKIKTEFDIIYGEGIAKNSELLALGEKYGFIKKSGASYTYLPHKGAKYSDEVKLGRGYDTARKKLDSEKKIMNQLEREIRKAIKEDV